VECSKYTTDDCMIFFHDLAFPDVAKGFLYFKGKEGWSLKIYHTQQIVGVAWKGSIQPPQHIPDPKYEWNLPEFLTAYFNLDGSSKF